MLKLLITSLLAFSLMGCVTLATHNDGTGERCCVIVVNPFAKTSN